MSQLGVDQKNGPFWGLYYSIFLIVYRGPKGAHNFDQPPLRSLTELGVKAPGSRTRVFVVHLT